MTDTVNNLNLNKMDLEVKETEKKKLISKHLVSFLLWSPIKHFQQTARSPHRHRSSDPKNHQRPVDGPATRSVDRSMDLSADGRTAR